MPARAVVFVGPSLVPLPGGVAVEFRPPAKRGELLAAAAAGYDLVGLLDGEFDQSLSVSPKEVVAATKLGAHLYGAASMGALRACDCPDHMTGVGVIFADFRDGRLASEDEVAETYSSSDYRLVARPLVNVRRALELARNHGKITEAAASAILNSLRQDPFHLRDDRRIRSTVEHNISADAADEFMNILRSDEADLKKSDAQKLVDLLDRRIRCGGPAN